MLALTPEKEMRMIRTGWRSVSVLLLIPVFAILTMTFARAQDRPGLMTERQPNIEVATSPVSSGTLLSAEFPFKNWGQVRAGDLVEGRLTLPLYAGQQLVFPNGSTIRLTIASVQRVSEKTGAWQKIGREIVRAFNPLEKSVLPEYSITLKTAEIVSANGKSLWIEAEIVRAESGVVIQPQRGGATVQTALPSGEEKSAQKQIHARMLLRLKKGAEPLEANTLCDGKQQTAVLQNKAHAFLLNRLSASQSRPGDRFQAVLAEPVYVGGHDLNAGTIVEGSVVRSKPPRMLSRAGSLYLQVDRVASPQETILVSGTLSAAETSQRTVALDEEGILRGQKPGVKTALVDLGIAFALGKAADDIAEAPIRAAGAAMSDAAVANAARYFGLGTSVIFLVTRHGRDVQLPKYAEIEIEFGRAGEAS